MAEAEALAARLLERVETTLNGDAPGLGNRVSRLTGETVAPSADFYMLRDGESLPLYGETAADGEARADAAARIDQTDGYRLWQQIAAGGAEAEDDVWYLVELPRFADEDAAAEWLADAADRIGRNAAFEAVEFDAGAPVFGDESIAFTMTAADNGARYRGISLRVGDTVAAIDVIAPETPPAEVVEAFAESQAACLGTTGCVEPIPLADDPWDLHAAADDSGRNVDVGKVVPDQMPEDEETSEREGDDGAIAGGETYVSPAWGYTIRWDPEMWVGMPESADDGRQFHIAGSVLVMVRITGVESYGGDADACLAGIVESNAADEEDDAPLVLAEGRQAPALAAGAAGAMYDIGTFGVAYYECRTLVEGESALQVRFVAPARAYDMVLPALEELLAGIEVES